MYDEKMVAPMRAELVEAGFTEARSPETVEELVGSGKGSVLVAINSVCGCSAGAFRPALRAVMNELSGDATLPRPDRVVTVFAGQDREATAAVRALLHGYPPSSPSAALIKDGEVVFMLERRQIESSPPQAIAVAVRAAIESHCNV